MKTGKQWGCWIAFLLMGQLAMAQPKSAKDSIIIRQIMAVELQFQNDLNNIGVAYAFEKYATTDAVIKRENDTLVIGAAAIKNYYAADFYKNAKAYWKPDYVDVSKDGTMAYTYGRYEWTFTGKDGKQQKYTGVFHTVWKRQKDKSWKYVWD